MTADWGHIRHYYEDVDGQQTIKTLCLKSLVVVLLAALGLGLGRGAASGSESSPVFFWVSSESEVDQIISSMQEVREIPTAWCVIYDQAPTLKGDRVQAYAHMVCSGGDFLPMGAEVKLQQKVLQPIAGGIWKTVDTQKNYGSSGNVASFVEASCQTVAPHDFRAIYTLQAGSKVETRNRITVDLPCGV